MGTQTVQLSIALFDLEFERLKGDGLLILDSLRIIERFLFGRKKRFLLFQLGIRLIEFGRNSVELFRFRYLCLKLLILRLEHQCFVPKREQLGRAASKQGIELSRIR